MTMQAVRPGWYGDGSGASRWWTGGDWSAIADTDPPEPLLARAALADTDEDVEMLPRHGIVAPAASLEHGPLRRGRGAPAPHRFPTFAVVATTAVAGTVWLGVWLMGRRSGGCSARDAPRRPGFQARFQVRWATLAAWSKWNRESGARTKRRAPTTTKQVPVRAMRGGDLRCRTAGSRGLDVAALVPHPLVHRFSR